jgi:outer membrane protein assembly factor BamD (BamD/ComL family)
MGVPKIIKEVRSARAAKQYQVGRFYLRTGKTQSAAYYFRLVARDFADTEWAGRARAELTKISPPKKAPPKKAPAKAVKPAKPKQPTTLPAGKAPARKEAKK